MATGSTDTGRWTGDRGSCRRLTGERARRSGAARAGARADVAAAPLADGEAVAPPHAAMTMPIEPIDRPTIAPRWMNSRRLSRPATKASTTSSCSGTAERRTLSNLG